MDFLMYISPKQPDEQFLREVIEDWQQYSEEPLTLEDAREFVSVVTGLADLFDRWDRENNKNEEIKCEK